MPRFSESQLLAALRAGEATAVTTWFQMYHDRLLRFVTLKISDPADAQEITQEIFINCLRHLPLFRGSSSLWTWMQSIARHEMADYFRKKYAKKAIKSLPLHEFVSDVPISDAHEVSERVKAAFQALSKESQELLMMKYIDRKKVKEIAAEVGRSVKAVESDLFRARLEFRDLYLLAK
jgi:RNA polymerase sigma-70 factor, ECF subfamily